MAIAAFIILAFLIFFMVGNLGVFREKANVYTFMNDAQSVDEGSDVRLNGILIGKINKVELSGSSDPTRVIRIVMEVDDQYLGSIPVDSQAGVGAANILGTKFINIKKGQARETIKAGAELPSSVTPELQDIFEQSSSTLAALQLTIKKINDIVNTVESGRGTIGELLVDDTMAKKLLAILDSAQATINEANHVVASLNSDQNSIGRILHDNNELYGQVHQGLTNINEIIDKVNSGNGTIARALNDPAIYDQARDSLMQLHDILAGIQAGQGTLGKVIKSDELHEQVKGTLAQVNTLLDKINNGQGTISQLLNNPSLYESFDGTTREMQGLLKDFRANPKKFLHIKLGLF
ncbi:MAG: MCE family protein [Bryobacterales bacterium]|nr:MCE family protein [Bryobacterales bacterium]MBV9397102.1 MCE family protein [Bryobacterales bacterium]